MKSFEGKNINKLLIIILVFLSSTNWSYSQKFSPDKWKYIAVDSTRQKWGDWKDPDWLRYFGLDFADVNRDGLMDIISGRYIYHNPGGDMTKEWKRVVLDDNVDAILCVDVDNDPIADFIAQALPDVYWFEALNQEGTRFRKKRIAEVPATGHVNSQGIEIGQIIPGGKPEILIAGNGNIYCISIPDNPETEKLWATRLICENTSDEGIGIGDINGDGYNDIACGRRPEGEEEPLLAVWYENPGTIANQWESSIIGSSQNPMDRFKIVDLTGDGKVEVVVTEERYPGLEPDGSMYWFSRPNDLKQEWGKNSIVTQYSMNNLDVADLDNDGDIDLVTNEHKGPNLELQIWENDGKANFTKHVIDKGKENHLGTKLIDMDADGDLDIAGAAWDNYKWLHVWRNDFKKVKSNIYREYNWIPEEQLNDRYFLRVGGQLDYNTEPQNFKQGILNEGNIRMFENLNLEDAIGAELIFERIQSHNDTKGLRFQVNGHDWIPVPFPPTIKENAEQYMFHFSPRVPVPLEQLKSGVADIHMEVSPEQAWGWPQNLFYGITLRIYYQNDKVADDFEIAGVSENEAIQNNQEIRLITNHAELIDRVDFIGFFEDVNWQGDGAYRQWQFNFHEGKIGNHIGTAKSKPFKVNWNTEWIPDQSKPIKVKARIVLKTGLITETAPVEGLRLERNYTVKLVKPFQVPDNWVTRNQRYTEKISIPLESKNIQEAKIYWRSWSPCYSEGITVNGILINYENEWPCYDYMEHCLDIDPNHLLKGVNSISTLKTALHNGQMVHGMEVQWPGIQLKVRSQKPKAESKFKCDKVMYEEREHFRIETKNIVYYYDLAGGGFSRMIDKNGNDWISFKMKPWNEYPASAASSFRGFPNMVFIGDDAGAGHPGHDKCRSWIEKDQVVSETLNGKWKWLWYFEKDYAVLDVLNVAEGEKYWILYEGTPGGNFKPGNYTFGTSELLPTNKINDYYKGETKHGLFDWIFNSCTSAGNTFFMVQVEQDEHLDLYGFLGNSEAGLESADGMTVFGFGRGKETNPLLDKPQKFIFGLYSHPIKDAKSYKELSKYIKVLVQSQIN